MPRGEGRSVKEFDTVYGKRFRVRYRQGGTETSETFRRRDDANTFAALVNSGPQGVREALGWLAIREANAAVETFGEFFESWAEQLTGITPRTRSDYHAIHRRYLTELDDLPMTLIARPHIAAIVNRLDREAKSPKTIKNVVHMLSSVFNYALDQAVIPRNPCRRVRLPKMALTDHEPRFLLPEEFAALVDGTPAHYRPLIVWLAGTGMRWSEATALCARHVDLAHGTAVVRQAWKRIPGGFEVGPPKSQRARRTVNAAAMALVAVEPLLRKPDDYVFITPRCNVVRHSNFYNRIWVPAVEKAGLADRGQVPTPHALRHTHASWLISDGQTLEAVQDQLGHESIETTRKVYGHLLPAVGVAVGKSASEAMHRALGDRVEFSALALPDGAGGPDDA